MSEHPDLLELHLQLCQILAMYMKGLVSLTGLYRKEIGQNQTQALACFFSLICIHVSLLAVGPAELQWFYLLFIYLFIVLF
jgi:hypothetical protein